MIPELLLRASYCSPLPGGRPVKCWRARRRCWTDGARGSTVTFRFLRGANDYRIILKRGPAPHRTAPAPPGACVRCPVSACHPHTPPHLPYSASLVPFSFYFSFYSSSYYFFDFYSSLFYSIYFSSFSTSSSAFFSSFDDYFCTYSLNSYCY